MDNEQKQNKWKEKQTSRQPAFSPVQFWWVAVGLSTASQQEREFSSEREAQNGGGQEGAHSGHSSAAVATKNIVAAAAKKQRGKMGVAP